MSSEQERSGPPMVSAADAEALAAERAELAELAGKPLRERVSGYARRSGPGWLQSAMTLGGGSAFSSLFLGAYFGFELLWLQPLAMVFGIVMLSAMSHQTLSTQQRPFVAMRKYGIPGIAWAWAFATLLSTLIWHFPQYGLAAGMTKDMVSAATGWTPTGAGEMLFLFGVGILVLLASTAICWNYSKGHKGIRLYERALKLLVWLIIIALAVVVVRGTIAGRVPWGRVVKGFLPLSIPTTGRGVSVMMAAFGAAVGINMTFLYPYSLLARGWGREHRGLAKFDLLTGMLVPFTVASSLMVVAAGATIAPVFEDYAVADIKADGLVATIVQTIEKADPEQPVGRARLALWQSIPEAERTLLSSEPTRGALVEALNGAIRREGTFPEESLAEIALARDGADVLRIPAARRSAKQTRLLNRLATDTILTLPAAEPGAKPVALVEPCAMKMPPTKAAAMLESAGLGKVLSRFVFGLGILAMALSTITTHMLVNGFAFCEVFGLEPKGWKYKLACLTPAPGLLGVMFWPKMSGWIAVPTSAVCGLLLPIAYIAFFLMNNRSDYLGADKPRGRVALLWNLAMLVAIVASLSSSLYYIYVQYLRG